MHQHWFTPHNITNVTQLALRDSRRWRTSKADHLSAMIIDPQRSPHKFPPQCRCQDSIHFFQSNSCAPNKMCNRWQPFLEIDRSHMLPFSTVTCEHSRNQCVMLVTQSQRRRLSKHSNQDVQFNLLYSVQSLQPGKRPRISQSFIRVQNLELQECKLVYIPKRFSQLRVH